MKKNPQICWISNLQTFTIKIFCSFLLFSLTQSAVAQFQDDFSDGDFTTSPAWIGDDSRFLVTGNRLKLNAPNEDGIAYLSTPYSVAQNSLWEFKFQFDFNPSGNNYARVYITTDRPNLSEPLNGYFVMIGDSKDEVSLYQQTGTTISKIIDGRDGLLNRSTIGGAIRVIRDVNLGWKLFTSLDEEDYVLEGTAENYDPGDVASYFGIMCTYTATRSDKFFFDDIKAQQNEIQDEIPPGIAEVQVISDQELRVVFSEQVDSISAVTTENYEISNGMEKPLTATFESTQKSVRLTFKNSFVIGTRFSLRVSNVGDLAGNIMNPVAADVIFVPPTHATTKDIVVTEIFADPSPARGLPELEFVELYNRSDKAFHLLDWTLTDHSSTATLPDHILLSHEYVILTAPNSEHAWFGHETLYLSNFPSLNNTGDILILRDETGTTIDSVQYFESWYRDEEKSEGGWTLEIIDPNNICSAGDNWAASEDERGGTPGFQNSIFANKPDLTGPVLVSVIPINAATLLLQFDEKLERNLPSTTSFDIDPNIAVEKVSFHSSDLTTFQLSLEQDIQAGVSYQLDVQEIYDCAGNLLQENSSKAVFGLPEEADSLDVLVNEILFNPRPTGVDFVEIVNVSTKYLNLKDWSVTNIDSGVVQQKTALTSENFLLHPGGLLVLTENANVLKGEYPLSKEQTFLTVKKLPALNDDQGSVALVDPSGKVIDFFSYEKGMHSIFINDEEGVSLERISSVATDAQQNWKSASASVGFATPGYENSNAFHGPDPSASTLAIEPEIFNPLAGQSNFTLIRYRFDAGGYIANVKIFDSQGHLIKGLANNDILGTTGFYRWDGDRDDGSKASLGYYMVWFEIFNAAGEVKNFKKRVAIASAF